MRENKLSLILNRIFHIIFLALFGINFICILFCGYSYTNEQRPWIIASFLFFTLFFAFVYALLSKHQKRITIKNRTAFCDKNTKIIIAVGIFLMLAVQLFIGYLLRMNPVTDMQIINNYSLDFAKSGNFSGVQSDYLKGSVYMARYPNNMALYLLLSFLYRFTYLIFGYVPRFVPVVMNALAINIGVLFAVLTAKKVFGNKKAIFTLIMCVLFIPYYTYVPYFYTDSLSLPFVTSALYLFVCAIKSQTKYKKYIMAAVCGALILIGYKLKGSVMILLAVMIVYLILKMGIKKMLCFALSLIVGFSAVGAVYSAGVNSLGVFTKEQLYESEYPLTHWVLMGLKGEGHYNLADSNYTCSFPNKDAKNEADIKAIKQRISEMSAGDFAYHLLIKAMWTWEDGTYFISHHIQSPVKRYSLHDYVLEKGKNYNTFYEISCGWQIMLLLLICMSILKGCIKPEINEQTIFKGIILCAMLFFLVWETRSRYLYNFTPIFILTAVDGMDFVFDKAKNFASRHKHIKYEHSA